MAHRTKSPEKKNRHIGWKEATAVLAGSAAIFSASACSVNSGEITVESTHDKTSGATIGSSELNTASPSDFYSDALYTDQDRINWAEGQLQAKSTDPEYPNGTVLQAAHDRLNHNLSVKGRMSIEELTGVSSPLATPSLSDSANQINAHREVIIASAVYEQDSDKAEKILAAAFDNTNVDNVRNGVRKDHQHSDSERLRLDTQISFTPADANVLQSTGKVVELISGFIEENPPTRVLYQTDSQQIQPDLEEQVSWINNRWIETAVINRNKPSNGKPLISWVEPSDLRNTGAQR